MKMILASNNPEKLREVKEILEPYGVTVISQSEAGIRLEVEETGTTFAENSELKAKAVYDLTHMPVIADDSGIAVDALNGEPGIYSARYGGEGLNDVDRCHLLLKNMEGVPDEERTARFVCVITYFDENGQKHQFDGKIEGKIGYEMIGSNGFGYDPLFMVGDRSLAEYTDDEKNSVSHRGNALRKLEAYLKETQVAKKASTLNSKQRSYLKAYAANIEPTFQIGKGGISEAQVKSIDDYLTAHEIVKVKCLENSLYTAREAAEELADKTNSEVVITIGSKAVLYRRNPKKPVIDFKS